MLYQAEPLPDKERCTQSLRGGGGDSNSRNTPVCERMAHASGVFTAKWNRAEIAFAALQFAKRYVA